MHDRFKNPGGEKSPNGKGAPFGTPSASEVSASLVIRTNQAPAQKVRNPMRNPRSWQAARLVHAEPRLCEASKARLSAAG